MKASLTPEALEHLALNAQTLAAGQQFAADADRLRAKVRTRWHTGLVPIFRN
ncbi:hypothetical protein [Novosphingobium gossypii]|uniref:hypothetical protein n=1 Tax=Novosphingobium gossypii TaxID=1604774 RepID=UPI003D1EE305